MKTYNCMKTTLINFFTPFYIPDKKVFIMTLTCTAKSVHHRNLRASLMLRVRLTVVQDFVMPYGRHSKWAVFYRVCVKHYFNRSCRVKLEILMVTH